MNKKLSDQNKLITPIRPKGQNTSKENTIKLKLPADHVINLKKGDEPVVLQKTKDFLEKVKRELDGDLTEITQTHNRDIIKEIKAKYHFEVNAGEASMFGLLTLIITPGNSLSSYMKLTDGGEKFLLNLGSKYTLYLNRLVILQVFVDFIKENTTKSSIEQEIVNYTKMSYANVPLNLEYTDETTYTFMEKLKKLSAEEREVILTQPENAQIIEKLNKTLSAIMTAFQLAYRNTYRLYKKVLSLIVSSIEFQDPKKVSFAKGTIFSVLCEFLTNRHDYIDGHYFMEMLRIYAFGPAPGGHVMPQFKKEEAEQITVYLTEHMSLLMLSIYYKMEKGVNQEDLLSFNFLPISKIINKEASQFFNMPISKNTYSLLLMYLTSITQALTLYLVQTIVKYK
jgi:hypothetical protein